MSITNLKLVTGYYLGVGTPSIITAVAGQIVAGWTPVGAPQLTDTYGQCAQTMVQTAQPGATAYTAIVGSNPQPPDATWDPLGAALWVDTTTWLQAYTKGNQYVAPISLTTQIAGILGIVNGGTGATDAATARSNLQTRFHNTTPLSGIDLNTLNGTAEGNYRSTSGSLVLNYPEATGGVLCVFQTGATGTTGCLQFYTTNTGGRTYVRSFSASWSNWVAFSNVTDIIQVTNGGTGATDAATARSNLGIGTIGTLNSVSLTANVSGILPIANGGTNANNAANARANLGVGTIGTLNSVDLTSNVTGILPIANGGTNANNIATARSNLGLGSMATQDSTSVGITGGNGSFNTLATISGATEPLIIRTQPTGNGYIRFRTSADVPSAYLGFSDGAVQHLTLASNVGSNSIKLNTTGSVVINATSAVYAFQTNGTATATLWSSSSDQRIKKNIQPIVDPYSVIEKITGYTFDKKRNWRNPEADFIHNAGLLAQEVKEVLPGHVSADSGDGYDINGNSIPDVLSLDYSCLTPYLLEAVKDLNARLKALESSSNS